jgi:hypothetical protein
MVVGFSLMFARFLHADDPNDPIAAPCVGYAVNLSFDAAKGYESQFAVVLPIIDPLDDFVGENLGGGEKRDAVLGDVLRRLVLVPLELQFIHSRPLPFNHTLLCTHRQYAVCGCSIPAAPLAACHQAVAGSWGI